MNIVFVSFELPPHNNVGGIGTYVYNMATLLFSLGHKVYVISAAPRDNFFSEDLDLVTTFENKIIAVSDPDTFRLRALAVFEELHKETPIDFIESPEAGACGLLIKEKFPEIPLIVKLHSSGSIVGRSYNAHTPIYARIKYVLGELIKGKVDFGYWSRMDLNRFVDPEFKIYQISDITICPSNALIKRVRQYWGSENKTIHLIRNPYFGLKIPFEQLIKGKKKQICFVGKLTQPKGVIELAKALRGILRKFCDYNMVFVGRDESGIIRGKRVESLQLEIGHILKDFEERVSFTGVLSGNDLNKVYRESLICVVPSQWENYPNVILEAMSFGCIVLGSNVGGIPEIINKTVGSTFKAGSYRDLARNLKSLLELDDKLMKAQNAYDFIWNNSFNEKIITDYLSLIQKNID